ncbi:MAG TPA: SUMF1/EgtB/PvdO family nonheme iron enzyme [Anaerolineales bacterium]|nr:SUMF1/EgtB/PvdO family nonheme iron enzyme [Anaerolineales bacterium]
MNVTKWVTGAALLSMLTSCAPAPTPVPVTLTAPVPTPTSEALELVPPIAIGAAYAYADGTLLVGVPHGEFIMGHGSADNPEHKVILSDYWIYSTEVSNAQYSLCVAQGWCSPPDPLDNPEYGSHEASQRPVVGVSFEQAHSYCQFMGGDLPTEAQWEKAARGETSARYPWGDADPTCELANVANCLKHADDVTSGERGRSSYGALNMAGNVYEWVADWFDALYYDVSPTGDPSGPSAGRARVVRSSSYHSSADQSLSYARSFAAPDDHRPDLGFRCAVSQPGGFAPSCSLAPVLPAGRMAGASVSCPRISIDVEVTACRYGGGAAVTFNDDQERDPNGSFGGIVGCTLVSGSPGVYPITYECRRSSTAVMTSRCSYNDLPEGDCPNGYRLDLNSGLCQWQAARSPGIECPSGQFYDPVAHCCSITTGKPEDFPVCPVGSSFTAIGASKYACVPAGFVQSPPAISKAVNPPVCGNLCELTVELCSIRNLVFCPTTCACLAVGRKCPDS